MATAENTELVDAFGGFFRAYYDETIKELARNYPGEQRSLFVDWDDLYRYDHDLADDYLAQPGQLRRHAEEALRLYDLPIDVSLGRAHVRVKNLPESASPEIREIRADEMNTLVEVRGIVRKATDVRPKVVDAAFECRLCGTLNRISQHRGEFQEPHQCQGCERKGPFRLNEDQSEFVDAQKLRIQESPEGLRGGETPQALDVTIEDDVTGLVSPGDHVSATGILRLEQQGSQQEQSPVFDFYMEGVAIEVDEEEFEEMDIDDADIEEITALASSPDVYEQIVDSIAPSIWGYDDEKLAMALQLFSGVTKHLPDGSRVRGDMHVLLVGDPGTGKSQLLSYIQNIAPRSVYTSGKGSSSAGLCVTGDTLVHTADGFREIEQIVSEQLPDAVESDTAVEERLGVYTFDRGSGLVERGETDLAWRMPEKPCVRLETERGKTLQTSETTPVLVCGETGLMWRSITDVEPGDHVAVPKYTDIERSTTSIHRYLEFTTEKLTLAPASIETVRSALWETFGTLREAAAELGFSEDFIYDTLSNRRVPVEKLETVLDATDLEWADLTVERAMVRHGWEVTIPQAFSEDLCYLIGLVFGDGDISLSPRGANRGCVRISNSDRAILERAADIMETEFGTRPEIETQEDRVPCIRLHSVTVARLFANLGMQTPKDDLAFDPALTTCEHADALLRGLLDADGSVSVRTGRGASSVQFSTISERLATQVQLMLETYGIRARCRERDRRGTSTLENGQEIRTTHLQYHLALYGRAVDRFAEVIGFESEEKTRALNRIVDATERRGETIPIGDVLQETSVSPGAYHDVVAYGRNPSRERAEGLCATLELGSIQSVVEEVVNADLCWEEVTAVEGIGEREVFDLTVPNTHNFLANGIVTHNTAAAVRDDFSDGQQWSLEAGALVLADLGIAAIDELDKMRCVTGDTVVETTIGPRRIEDIAAELERTGTTERHERGRTHRGGDVRVKTVSDDGTVITREVTAAHVYEAPSTLVCVTLQRGAELTATPDHPFILPGGETRPAVALEPDDQVLVPGETVRPDGGSLAAPTQSVAIDSVASIEPVESDRYGPQPKVYDLTVEETHNFVANGMVVHNSEDRSAMHEALEQQSYHPDSEILLADGRRLEIGDLVDRRMEENPDAVVDGVDCEILPVENLRVHTVDLETAEVTKAPVDRVSRHEAPDEFVRVTFSNGREITVTPDHPMFVDDGQTVVPAADLEEGAFVPAPRKLPNAAGGVALEGTESRSREKNVELPDSMTPDLAEFLGLVVAEGHTYAGSCHEIGFSNQDERLLQHAESLGQSLFGFESYETINEHGTVTKRWVSTRLYRWFEKTVPEVMATARGKRIPAAVLGSSEEIIRRFLVGAFAGDGGVESEAMSISTASPGLAEDYADALAKLGIGSRIHHDRSEDAYKVYIMGDSTRRFVEQVVQTVDDRYDDAVAFAERSEATPRHHDVLPTSVAVELRGLRRQLGLRLTGRYRLNLDEQYGVRIETVEDELGTLRERVETVRTGLAEAETLEEVRAVIDWSMRELGERIDETESTVRYAEDGGYDERRRAELAEAARWAVGDALRDAERRIGEIETQCSLRYYRVREVETIPNEGEDACEWVYDVTVEPTNTFVSKGVVLHNSISISKAGINATLKSRCSLLGAANPEHGRFDEYEKFGEQIDLEPALVSRFDLIFIVTDSPDPERDSDLAAHILQTNYAGELETQRREYVEAGIDTTEIDEAARDVTPAIEPELFRKYVAHAKQSCHPRMSDEARQEIKDFYVDMREKGAKEDAPVPITARKLEALVRLAEASARVRLSDTVEPEDAERVIALVRSSLEDIAYDPETGQFDVDIVESGTSKSQRDRIHSIKEIVEEVQQDHENGAPIEEVLDIAEDKGLERSLATDEIESLKQKGELYSPSSDTIRTLSSR